jgi:hypothetical protein
LKQGRIIFDLTLFQKGGMRILKKLFSKPLEKLLPCYLFIMLLLLIFMCSITNAYAADNIWVKGKALIIDIYNQIVGISTVLAGLMSAIAVIGATLSNNQHQGDQAWDWWRRSWIAWAIINGIGAFIAYITPLFEGLHTL